MTQLSFCLLEKVTQMSFVLLGEGDTAVNKIKWRK